MAFWNSKRKKTANNRDNNLTKNNLPAEASSRSAKLDKEALLQAYIEADSLGKQSDNEKKDSDTPKKQSGIFTRAWSSVKNSFKTASSFFGKGSLTSDLVAMKKAPSNFMESYQNEKTPDFKKTDQGLKIFTPDKVTSNNPNDVEETQVQVKREKASIKPDSGPLKIDLADGVSSFETASSVHSNLKKLQTPTLDTKVSKSHAKEMKDKGEDVLKAQTKKLSFFAKLGSSLEVLFTGEKNFRTEDMLIGSFILLENPSVSIKSKGIADIESYDTKLLLPGIKNVKTPDKVNLRYDIANKKYFGDISGFDLDIEHENLEFQIKNLYYKSSEGLYSSENAIPKMSVFGGQFTGEEPLKKFRFDLTDYTYVFQQTYLVANKMNLFDFIQVENPRFIANYAKGKYNLFLTRGDFKIVHGTKCNDPLSSPYTDLSGLPNLSYINQEWTDGIENGSALLRFGSIDIEASGINAYIEDNCATISKSEASEIIEQSEFKGEIKDLHLDIDGYCWNSFNLLSEKLNLFDLFEVENPEFTVIYDNEQYTDILSDGSFKIKSGNETSSPMVNINAGENTLLYNSGEFSEGLLSGNARLKFGSIDVDASDIIINAGSKSALIGSAKATDKILDSSFSGDITGLNLNTAGYNWDSFELSSSLLDFDVLKIDNPRFKVNYIEEDYTYELMEGSIKIKGNTSNLPFVELEGTNSLLYRAGTFTIDLDSQASIPFGNIDVTLSELVFDTKTMSLSASANASQEIGDTPFKGNVNGLILSSDGYKWSSFVLSTDNKLNLYDMFHVNKAEFSVEYLKKDYTNSLTSGDFKIKNGNNSMADIEGTKTLLYREGKFSGGLEEGISTLKFGNISVDASDIKINTNSKSASIGDAKASEKILKNSFKGNIKNLKLAKKQYKWTEFKLSSETTLNLYDLFQIDKPEFSVEYNDEKYTDILTSGNFKIKNGNSPLPSAAEPMVNIDGEKTLSYTSGKFSGGLKSGTAELQFGTISVDAGGIIIDAASKNASTTGAQASQNILNTPFTGIVQNLNLDKKGYKWSNFKLGAPSLNFLNMLHLLNPLFSVEYDNSNYNNKLTSGSFKILNGNFYGPNPWVNLENVGDFIYSSGIFTIDLNSSVAELQFGDISVEASQMSVDENSGSINMSKASSYQLIGATPFNGEIQGLNLNQIGYTWGAFMLSSTDSLNLFDMFLINNAEFSVLYNNSNYINNLTSGRFKIKNGTASSSEKNDEFVDVAGNSTLMYSSGMFFNGFDSGTAKLNFGKISVDASDISFDANKKIAPIKSAPASANILKNTFSGNFQGLHLTEKSYLWNSLYLSGDSFNLYDIVRIENPLVAVIYDDGDYTDLFLSEGIKIMNGKKEGSEDAKSFVDLNGECTLIHRVGNWSGGIENGSAKLNFGSITANATGINFNSGSKSASVENASASGKVAGTDFSGNITNLTVSQGKYDWDSFTLSANSVSFYDYINITSPKMDYTQNKSENSSITTISAKDAKLNIAGFTANVEGGITAQKTDFQNESEWYFKIGSKNNDESIKEDESADGSIEVSFCTLNFNATNVEYSSSNKLFTADHFKANAKFLGSEAQADISGFKAGSQGFDFQEIDATFSNLNFFNDTFSIKEATIKKDTENLCVSGAFDFDFAGLTGGAYNASVNFDKTGKTSGTLNDFKLACSFFNLKIGSASFNDNVLNISNLEITTGSGNPEGIKASDKKDEAQSFFGGASKYLQYIGLEGFGLKLGQVTLENNSTINDDGSKNESKLKCTAKGLSFIAPAFEIDKFGFKLNFDLATLSGSLKTPEFTLPDNILPPMSSTEINVPILGIPFLSAKGGIELFGYMSLFGEGSILNLTSQTNSIDSPSIWQINADLGLKGMAGIKLIAGIKVGSKYIVSLEGGLYGEARIDLLSKVGISSNFEYKNKDFLFKKLEFPYSTDVDVTIAGGIYAKASAFYMFEKKYEYELAKWNAGLLNIKGNITKDVNEDASSFINELKTEFLNYKKSDKKMILDVTNEDGKAVKNELIELNNSKGTTKFEDNKSYIKESFANKLKKMNDEFKDVESKHKSHKNKMYNLRSKAAMYKYRIIVAEGLLDDFGNPINENAKNDTRYDKLTQLMGSSNKKSPDRKQKFINDCKESYNKKYPKFKKNLDLAMHYGVLSSFIRNKEFLIRKTLENLDYEDININAIIDDNDEEFEFMLSNNNYDEWNDITDVPLEKIKVKNMLDGSRVSSYSE
ncbi:hypothetical protein RBH29_02800 [Herbivorax sp. ANBcel31]|uniref:hypothetical protein n=1 Tax=Herbivorax sp. ANBcel31 TaxID=3069754 RepID=UPI0027B10399|nr:hypothetical protein [Herbivorax sp. ANBcel31]MDQ2085367.1 hypothetical protein [Herbivorax sp. ANBcel31]